MKFIPPPPPSNPNSEDFPWSMGFPGRLSRLLTSRRSPRNSPGRTPACPATCATASPTPPAIVSTDPTRPSTLDLQGPPGRVVRMNQEKLQKLKTIVMPGKRPARPENLKRPENKHLLKIISPFFGSTKIRVLKIKIAILQDINSCNMRYCPVEFKIELKVKIDVDKNTRIKIVEMMCICFFWSKCMEIKIQLLSQENIVIVHCS